MKTPLDDILSARLPNYERREVQGQMARGVSLALGGAKNLIVEAGTGTGKSLAYLLPLAEHTLGDETRAVVSTYTKALQRQLVGKDLPFVRDEVFADLRFCVSYGGENYLCKRRLQRARDGGLFEDDDARGLRALLQWAASTGTGLWADSPARPGLWSKVSRQGDLCRARQCAHFEGCHYQRAKARERRSHIIVVNHHLFFANMASGGHVLPEFQAVLFDEAHELEDVAAAHLGVVVSNFGLRRLLDGVLGPKGGGVLGGLRWLEPEDFKRLARAVDAVRTAGGSFFDELAGLLGPVPSMRIRVPEIVPDGLSAPLMNLSAELGLLVRASGDDEERAELEAMSARAAAYAVELGAVLSQEMEEHVFWAEATRRTVKLASSPIEVGKLLSNGLFKDLDTSVLTSATLSASGSFSYIRERLGLEQTEELLLESPFDYRSQALLYVPDDIPVPNTPGYEEAVIEEVGRILEITGGATLVLFTSHRMLRRAAEAINPEDVEILVQGDAESYALIEEFQRGGRPSAIFGTHTFWQGVDVPGDALRCVVIAKIPFAVPDEPLVEARMEALARRGEDPFNQYQVPRAALLLKQGFGRLIRSSTDRGAVAILDRRLLSRPYGRRMLDSLPECGMTSNIGDFKRFLGGTSPA